MILTSIDGLSVLDGIEGQAMALTGFGRGTTDLITAAVIIAASIVIARGIRLFLDRVAPGLAGHTQTTLDDEIIKAVNGPLQWLALGLGFYASLRVLSPYVDFLGFYLDRMPEVALIFIAAYLVANLLNGLLSWYRHDISGKTASDLDDVLVPFLQKIIGGVVAVIALLVALEQLKIVEITPLITGLGVAGIAVALAAQQFLSDFFGAVSIMVDRPYKVGDRVRIQDIDPGDVVEIGLRSTKLRTSDNRIIIVPNAKVSKSRVINQAMPDAKVYFTIRVGVAYDADVDRAARIMEEVALATRGVLPEPKPQPYVYELGNFSVRLMMLVYVSSYRLDWEVPDKIYRGIVRRFAAEGIEIPMPTTNVLIKRAGAAIAVPAQPPKTFSGEGR